MLRPLRWTADAVVTVSGAGQAEGCRWYHGGVGVWRTRLLNRMVDNHIAWKTWQPGPWHWLIVSKNNVTCQ